MGFMILLVIGSLMLGGTLAASIYLEVLLPIFDLIGNSIFRFFLKVVKK